MLGLKLKLHIKLPQSSIKTALDVLNENGFNNISLNGNKLSIELSHKERILPLRKLFLAEIPVEDFNVEEPSMESIMEEVQQNGL